MAGRAATGFKFAPVTSDNLGGALRRAHAAFQDKAAWRKIQHAGMATDVSWRNRASRYAELYRELAEARTM
jgi:starch synthase